MKSRKEPAAHLAEYLNQEAQQIASIIERLAQHALNQAR
jgi:hypothetical protein